MVGAQAGGGDAKKKKKNRTEVVPGTVVDFTVPSFFYIKGMFDFN
jgi:hypothetical protein